MGIGIYGHPCLWRPLVGIRFFSSVSSSSQNGTKTVAILNQYLKRLYLKVHPDLFTHVPSAQQLNSQSLASLNSVLDYVRQIAASSAGAKSKSAWIPPAAVFTPPAQTVSFFCAPPPSATSAFSRHQQPFPRRSPSSSSSSTALSDVAPRVDDPTSQYTKITVQIDIPPIVSRAHNPTAYVARTICHLLEQADILLEEDHKAELFPSQTYADDSQIQAPQRKLDREVFLDAMRSVKHASDPDFGKEWVKYDLKEMLVPLMLSHGMLVTDPVLSNYEAMTCMQRLQSVIGSYFFDLRCLDWPRVDLHFCISDRFSSVEEARVELNETHTLRIPSKFHVPTFISRVNDFVTLRLEQMGATSRTPSASTPCADSGGTTGGAEKPQQQPRQPQTSVNQKQGVSEQRKKYAAFNPASFSFGSRKANSKQQASSSSANWSPGSVEDFLTNHWPNSAQDEHTNTKHT